MRRHRIQIYSSREHLAATILFLAAPFAFLLIFSELENLRASALFSDVLISAWRLAIAYVIALILAWFSAVVFYRGRRSAIALPVFDVLQSFPTFAILPAAILIFGRSSGTVIFFLVITIIWPIFFSIVSSLKLIRHDWEEVVEITGLSGMKYLLDFIIPISIPGVITGSLIGLGEGWGAIVATEIIVGIPGGLGPFFENFAANPTVTAFGIFGVLLLVFAINKLVWSPLLERSHRMMEE